MSRTEPPARHVVEHPDGNMTLAVDEVDPDDREVVELHDPDRGDENDPRVVLSILRRGRVECETAAGGELNLDIELCEQNYYIVRAAQIVAAPGQAVVQDWLASSRLREIIYLAATSGGWVETEVRSGGMLDDARLPPPKDLALLRAMHDLAVYYAEYVVRGNPTKALAKEFDISRAAAAQRIARLRDRQLLGEVEHGKAGL